MSVAVVVNDPVVLPLAHDGVPVQSPDVIVVSAAFRYSRP
jgi:hypothetical protein